MVLNWTELEKLSGSGLPGFERPNPFRMAPPPRRSGTAKRRQPNPFADFMRGPYGNDSTAPRPSFSFRFRMPRAQRQISQSFNFTTPVKYHHYRVSMSAPSAEQWTFGDFDFFNHDTKLIMTPSKDFRSAWMSAGKGREWVYVDLGTLE